MAMIDRETPLNRLTILIEDHAHACYDWGYDMELGTMAEIKTCERRAKRLNILVRKYLSRLQELV